MKTSAMITIATTKTTIANIHSLEISYTKEELLNLKPKAYIDKIDIHMCTYIKKLKNKMQPQKEREGRCKYKTKHAQEFRTKIG